jgi:hypothetical protein
MVHITKKHYSAAFDLTLSDFSMMITRSDQGRRILTDQSRNIKMVEKLYLVSEREITVICCIHVSESMIKSVGSDHKY